MQKLGSVAVVATMVAVCLIAGCEVDSHKNGDGDNVKIATPFGGLQVKTNDAVVLEGLGLPAYPGAVAVKKDHDNGAADVNMSFGNFQLRVKALGYRTSDSPEKVQVFYRDELRKVNRQSRAVSAYSQTARMGRRNSAAL